MNPVRFSGTFIFKGDLTGGQRQQLQQVANPESMESYTCRDLLETEGDRFTVIHNDSSDKDEKVMQWLVRQQNLVLAYTQDRLSRQQTDDVITRWPVLTTTPPDILTPALKRFLGEVYA